MSSLLSQESFDHVRALLRQRSGHDLGDDKAYLVETRLLPLAWRHGLRSVDDLVLRLRASRSEALIEQVVEAMTINETLFFRDESAFECLRRVVLPDLVQRRAAEGRLAIWSAACASGQEPYSVALLLREHFPALARWQVRLLGSDIAPSVLARAQRGVYSALEVSRGLPAEMLQRYFHPVPDGWQIADEVRQGVEFQAINLVSPWPALPRFDLVLLRNVLIYFDMPTRQRLLERLRRVLRPDGYLMLGGAETAVTLDDQFEPVTAGQGGFFRLRGQRV